MIRSRTSARRRPRAAWPAAALGCATLAGCSTLIGIDDRQLDTEPIDAASSDTTVRDAPPEGTLYDVVEEAVVDSGHDASDGPAPEADGAEAGPPAQVMQIAIGADFTCALLAGGRVKCWGANTSGQLGLGDKATRGAHPGEMGDALPAVNLGTGEKATAITAGAGHACALLESTRVKCWGSNIYGQLGLGDTANRGDEPGEMGDALPAVALGAARHATTVVAGGYHTCARLDDGGVKCWGANGTGQLGLGDTVNRGDGPGDMGDALPEVNLGPELPSAVNIAAGGAHSCAASITIAKCWGNNDYGQLGLGDRAPRGVAPNQMGSNLLWIDYGAGVPIGGATAAGVSCGVMSGGVLKCWGYNGHGQLGRGDTSNRGDDPGEMGANLASVPLGNGLSVSSLAMSSTGYHTCVVLNGGGVKCWGSNYHGQLGLGDMDDRGVSPGQMGDALPTVDLGPAQTALAVTAGGQHTCAILQSRRIKCWGWSSDGQLGQGDTKTRGDQPNEMGALLPVVDLGP